MLNRKPLNRDLLNEEPPPPPKHEHMNRYRPVSVSGPMYPEMRAFNVRDEIEKLLHGSFEEPGIGRPVLIRRLSDTHCVCWDALRGSANPTCGACRGEGFQWIETLNTVYIARNFGSVINPSTVIGRQNILMQPGLIDENKALAIAEHHVFPSYERYAAGRHPLYDKLYELKVDSDGRMSRPAVRVAKWKIKSLTPHHGHNGRVEFFELGLEVEGL